MQTALHKIESVSALVYALLFGVAVLFAGLLIYVRPGDLPLLPTSILYACWVPLCAAEAFMLTRLLLLAGKNPIQLAPKFASLQARWFPPLAPLVCLWWIAHAVIGLFIMNDMLGVFEKMKPPPDMLWLQWLAMLGLTLAISHGTQFYLLCATASMTRNDAVLRFQWRFRFLFDGMLIIAMLVFPQRFRPWRFF